MRSVPPRLSRSLRLVGTLVAWLWPCCGQAQSHHHAAADSAAHHPTTQPSAHHHGASTDASMHDMDMSGMDEMPMNGALGPYTMSREASGTSWQPDATGHEGVHLMRGPWMIMLHGFADAVYDHQGGPRGDTKFSSDNMGMVMAQRPLGPGAIGLRSMLSLEPATIGQEGYPLLLQTGETADGRTPLIDRQHPHDLFMEMAGTYSVWSGHSSLFLYGGLPGEPALGPPAFMHRFSGAPIPVAPITHHWLDSTHITYGVLTAGAVVDRVKVEASAFRGREPDEDRWDIESPKLDSHSFRVSVNPTAGWALQASYGRIESPEQLEPDVNQDRFTTSVMVDGSWGDSGRWETTLAFGQNLNHPGQRLNAFLAEGAYQRGQRHMFFVRAEHVQKDELFLETDPRAGQVFDVGELTGGYRYDFLSGDHAAVGIGAAGTLSFVPSELRADYGSTPASGLLFVHVALR